MKIVPPPEAAPLVACVLGASKLPPHEVRIIGGPWRETASAVASRHGLSLADLVGPSEVRRIAHVRQEAFVAVRAKHGYSTTRIGQLFGGRDHTTVIHGLKAHARRKGETV